MNIAVITGASSGIGEHFLRQIVRERSVFGSIPFDEIWVIARRADRLLAMKNELDPVRIRAFMLDLTSDGALDDLADELKKRAPSIGLLINCAGVGYSGRFETLPRGEIHKIITLNCAALAEFTSVCLPYMIPIGDLCAYPTGPVATEFAAVATGVPGAKAKGFKSLFVVKPENLVKKSILASKKGRGLYVYGLSQKTLHVLAKILPASFLIFLVMKLSKDARPPEKPAPDQAVPAKPAYVQAAAVKPAPEQAVPEKPAPELSREPSKNSDSIPLTSVQASRILSLYPGKYSTDNTSK